MPGKWLGGSNQAGNIDDRHAKRGNNGPHGRVPIRPVPVRFHGRHGALRLLAGDESIRTADRHRLAGLHDARGLAETVAGAISSQQAETGHSDTRHQGNDHDLEMGGPVCAID
jgi:hypothetical protein